MSRLRIAFATADRAHVDQHFGAASAFAIYEIESAQARMVELTEFIDTSQDGNEAKLPARIATLAGCGAVYCLAVGASAVKQLLLAGVQPLRVDEGTPIAALIADLQADIAAGPTGWLARALRPDAAPDTARFDAMEAEGWHE